MKKLSLPTLAVVLGFATQATAAWAPSHYRCAFDQIVDPDQARGRQQWAKKWADADPYNLSPGKDQKFWAGVFDQDADTARGYNIWLYPVYVDPNQFYDPWIGPGGAGTATSGLTGDQLLNLAHTEKPAHILMDGVCEPGCYTPDQRVLFQGGLVPIRKAQQAGATDLVTLSPDASFDQVTLTNNTVESYTLDRDPVRQDVYFFRMQSGGRLNVTPEHPLVTADGTLKKAKDFVVGEHLVRQDGSTDEIVSLRREQRFGKVYNLRPVTKDLTSNILVAEGYLNGSARFQSEYVEELNRIIIRKNVPDALIP
ncbi:hypothetical protein ACLESD_19835 [Pyxidicoccus sp. 3LFB2]